MKFVPLVAAIMNVQLKQESVIVQITLAERSVQSVYLENMEFHVTRLVLIIVTTMYVGKFSVTALKDVNQTRYLAPTVKTVLLENME